MSKPVTIPSVGPRTRAGSVRTRAEVPAQPFLRLQPRALPAAAAAELASSLPAFTAALDGAVPRLARCLVQFSVAASNARQRRAGRAAGVSTSVLNRRRRAARAWLEAVAAARVDAPALHAVATQWLPQLIGCGPDLHLAANPGRALVEFVRGLVAGCIFDTPGDNLLPEAHAVHAAETVLAAHLQAFQAAVQRRRVKVATRV
jgi:hypothetical protein